MSKRLLAALLCLCMMVTLLPTAALAEEAPAKTISNSEMLIPNTDPGDEWESDASNPYGTNLDQPFSLNPISELVLYTNRDTTDETDRNAGGRIYTNNFAVDKSQSSVFDGKNYTAANSIASGSNTYLPDEPKAGYVSGIAFDPYGTGRADHAAYVGFVTTGTGKDTVTRSAYWVQNLKTGACTQYKYLDSAPNWKDTFYQYQARNFFSITAGDYDGDGKETVLITVPGNSGIRVMVTPAKESFTISTPTLSKTISASGFAAFAETSSTAMTSQLSISLASGDFDRDGMDELAVSASQCYTADQSSLAGTEVYKYDSWLTVFNGDGSNSFTALSQVNKIICSICTAFHRLHRIRDTLKN